MNDQLIAAIISDTLGAKSQSTQPRGWWTAAEAKRPAPRRAFLRDAARETRTIASTGDRINVRVHSDGATYFPTQHRGWIRLNPTRSNRRVKRAA